MTILGTTEKCYGVEKGSDSFGYCCAVLCCAVCACVVFGISPRYYIEHDART